MSKSTSQVNLPTQLHNTNGRTNGRTKKLLAFRVDPPVTERARTYMDFIANGFEETT